MTRFYIYIISKSSDVANNLLNVFSIIDSYFQTVNIMTTNLGFEQKAAISQLLNCLSSAVNTKWNKEKLFRAFEYSPSYNLDTEAKLGFNTFMNTLKALPVSIKRDTVCRVLNSWPFAGGKDIYSLCQALKDIILFNIETGVEYVLFNNLINFYTYFEVSPLSFIASAQANYYSIDMRFDCPDINYDDNCKVHFTTSSEDEIPSVNCSIGPASLKTKMAFTDHPSQEDISTLLRILTKNHFNLLPGIELDYSLKCKYTSGFGSHLRIIYENILFVDSGF